MSPCNKINQRYELSLYYKIEKKNKPPGIFKKYLVVLNALY
nr:MAG TPA: hypothetical protein [Caudoviricetes sp.]